MIIELKFYKGLIKYNKIIIYLDYFKKINKVVIVFELVKEKWVNMSYMFI